MSETKTKRRTNLTEEEAAALRAQVPDDAVKIPKDFLACDCCGVAVEVTATSEVTEAERVPKFGGMKIPNAVQVSRCSSCEVVVAEAAAYVQARPGLEVRMGNVAQDRVEQALFALQVLDRPRPSEAVFEAVWPRLWVAASRMRWANPGTVVPGKGSPHPWAHVGLEQRQQLRQAYAAGLNDRAARSQAPVVVPCPTVACLFCGVAGVRTPAAEVARLGGVEAVQRALWRRLAGVPPTALGGDGPDWMDGHLCPACTRALNAAGGAVGQIARAQAVVNHVQATLGDDKAQRLGRRVTDDIPPPVPAWAVMNRPPNQRPWEHLGTLLVRL